jgi:hypothetical protein
MACASGSSADIAERNNGDAVLSDQGALTIYGSNTDGTYVIEFRRLLARRWRLDPKNRDGRDPVFPGAYALWAVRAGCSVRYLKECQGE